MSYLVLARKFRPQTFRDVVGQQPIIKTLQNSLKRNRVAHAILFSGVRGVGKTTLARLMAKALNCETGPTPTPCNTCPSCMQIMAGNALDLHEIDGASNRGIQEVRDLKDKIKFLPTSARYKVIIIDEVHMLTTEAFNALLKTLEEPPEHVYFMFATTELHKIPVTILSRCQRYELRRVSPQELNNHVSRLATAEGVTLEGDALALIVREAEGSVRDALSLLDQVLAYGDTIINGDDVADVLGLVKRDLIHAIAEALLIGNRQTVLTKLGEAFDHGMDMKRFMTDLLDCFRSLMLLRISGCDELIDLPADELAVLDKTARQHSVETIHQKLNLLLQAAESVRHSSQPRIAVETAFLSIIEAGSVVAVTSLLSRLDEMIGSLPPSGNQPSAEDMVAPRLEQQPAPPDASPAPLNNETGPPPPPEPAEPLPTEPAGPVPEAVPPSGPADDKTPVHHHGQKDIRKDWLAFISYVKERREWMAQNLQQASTIREDGSELIIEFDNPAECTLLRGKDNRKTLTEYILDFFQKDFSIHIISPEEPDDSGATMSDGPKKRRQQLAAHPLVRMTEDVFSGQAGDIRISTSNNS